MTDTEAIKDQVWRVAEVIKTGVDEVGKLACLWLDSRSSPKVQNLPTGNAQMINQVMTIKELAEYLKTSERNVRQKTKNGEIHAFNIGKKSSLSKDYRYKLDDVLRELSNDPLQVPVIMQHNKTFKAVK